MSCLHGRIFPAQKENFPSHTHKRQMGHDEKAQEALKAHNLLFLLPHLFFAACHPFVGKRDSWRKLFSARGRRHMGLLSEKSSISAWWFVPFYWLRFKCLRGSRFSLLFSRKMCDSPSNYRSAAKTFPFPMAFCVRNEGDDKSAGQRFIGDGAPLAGFTAMIFACFVINYNGRADGSIFISNSLPKNYQLFPNKRRPVLLWRLTESSFGGVIALSSCQTS